ncbi:MAG: amidase family protein [Solirubrobacteraceae bacterium]
MGRVRRADDAGAGPDGDPRRGGYGRHAPLAVDVAGRFTPFTPIFNLTGQPAISVPAGVGGDGLPLAVQLVGRVGAEDTLYSLAGQIEEAAPWAQRRPNLS